MRGSLLDKMRNKKGQLGEIITEFYTFVILFAILAVFLAGSAAIARFKGGVATPDVVVSGTGDLLFKSVEVNWTEVRENGVDIAGKTGVEDKMIIDAYLIFYSKLGRGLSGNMNILVKRLLEDSSVPGDTCAYFEDGQFIEGKEGLAIGGGILYKKISDEEFEKFGGFRVQSQSGDAITYKQSNAISKSYFRLENKQDKNVETFIVKYYYGPCLSPEELKGERV